MQIQTMNPKNQKSIDRIIKIRKEREQSEQKQNVIENNDKMIDWLIVVIIYIWNYKIESNSSFIYFDDFVFDNVLLIHSISFYIKEKVVILNSNL